MAVAANIASNDRDLAGVQPQRGRAKTDIFRSGR